VAALTSYFQRRLDFTLKSIDFDGLPEYVNWLYDNGMRFITILDPAIDSEEKDYLTYIKGQKANIWIKWSDRRNIQFNETGNRNMLGYEWPDGKSTFICTFENDPNRNETDSDISILSKK
jgi:alpha-glucosidase (family GH31 glycosyl hydrolase)